VEEAIEVFSGSGIVAVDIESAYIRTKSLVVGQGLETCNALGKTEVSYGMV
jgi:hypothetical protein